MAKKLRKVGTPLPILFLELLIPWISMGVIAVLGLEAGLSQAVVFVAAIAGALATTLLIHRLERMRRRRRAGA